MLSSFAGGKTEQKPQTTGDTPSSAVTGRILCRSLATVWFLEIPMLAQQETVYFRPLLGFSFIELLARTRTIDSKLEGTHRNHSQNRVRDDHDTKKDSNDEWCPLVAARS